MPPVEQILTGSLPAGLAFVVVMAGILLRWTKQRGSQRQDEWSRMRDLLDELRLQRDRQDVELRAKDDLIEAQAEHITQLRRDARSLLAQNEQETNRD